MTNKRVTGSGGRVETTGRIGESAGKVSSGKIDTSKGAIRKSLVPLIKNSLGVRIRITVTFHNSAKRQSPAQALIWDLNPGEEYLVPKTLLPYIRYVNIEEVPVPDEMCLL